MIRRMPKQNKKCRLNKLIHLALLLSLHAIKIYMNFRRPSCALDACQFPFISLLSCCIDAWWWFVVAFLFTRDRLSDRCIDFFIFSLTVKILNQHERWRHKKKRNKRRANRKFRFWCFGSFYVSDFDSKSFVFSLSAFAFCGWMQKMFVSLPIIINWIIFNRNLTNFSRMCHRCQSQFCIIFISFKSFSLSLLPLAKCDYAHHIANFL